MEDLEEESLMMTTNFVNFMNNPEMWESHILSDNAILDWFGRSLFGRDSIYNFIRTHLTKMHLTVENVSKIQPIKHRTLKVKNIHQPSQQLDEVCMQERGQGDCKVITTPENCNRVNFNELLKAPKKRLCHRSFSDISNWQFLEVKGKLELDDRPDRKLDKIVLGCTDQIHLIVYEGKSNCKKKLSPLFSVADE